MGIWDTAIGSWQYFLVWLAAGAAAVWIGSFGLGSVVEQVMAAQPPTKTVLDGVYTDAQAERGKAQYLTDCASCHGDSLQGADEAPALAGDGFLAPWVDVSVGELYERTRISMPQDRPGKLSRAAYADIVAFMLKSNEFPSGDKELDPANPALQQIQIVAKPRK